MTTRGATVDRLLGLAVAGLAQRTDAGVVLLDGAPGIGKTTVLDAVAARLAAGGAEVRRARADELSHRTPFGVVRALLGLPPQFPPPADAAHAALEQVDALCAGRDVALLVDDAHHADTESLAVLRSLAAATHDLPLVLVLARRLLPARELLVGLAGRPGTVQVELGALTGRELDALVRAETGAAPGRELRQLLGTTGGNPFHAHELLADLRRTGRLAEDGGTVEVLDPDGTTVPASLTASVTAHLDLLDAPSRDLVDLLAVWGGPATLDELAAAGGLDGATLRTAARSAVGSGVLRWTADGRLAPRHDLFTEVAYTALAAPLRARAHAACARVLREHGGASTGVVHHLARAGASAPEVVTALRGAAADVEHAPALAAELLAEAASLATATATVEDPVRGAVAAERAGALARSGEMGRAGDVARAAMSATTVPAQRAQLRSLQIFAAVALARVDEALEALDTTLALPLPPEQLAWLGDLRAWVVLLGGGEPITEPAPGPALVGLAGERAGTGLVARALRAALAGGVTRGVALAEDAVALVAGGSREFWADGATAAVWPAWTTLNAYGPDAAAGPARRALRDAQDEGLLWLAPYLQFTSGGIAWLQGRWDDAVAELDAGLEAAGDAVTGWLSLAVGPRVEIDVARGDLDAAAARLLAWDRRDLPDQFGLPVPGQARALLLAAQGRAGPAASLAGELWAVTVGSGRTLWALTRGVETARLALLAGDRALLDRVASDVRAADPAGAPAQAPQRDLVAAVLDADAGAAAAAATELAGLGDVNGAMSGWEEAACAAAAAGDADGARGHAATALALQRGVGAAALERRLTSRLRGHGVRLGAAGARLRPSTGWDALTPTELQVAELVGAGRTGPEIARQLFVSPRTVQTHVSHALAKLGLRSRVELAAAVTARG